MGLYTAALSQATHRLIREGLTRQVFAGFPLWLHILWLMLAASSVVVFAFGVTRPLLRYRAASRAGLPSPREVPRLILRGSTLLMEHRTIGKRARSAGLAHAAVFYGWMTLFTATVVLAVDTDFTSPFFGVDFFTGRFYEWYSLLVDIMATVLTIGLIYLMVRRAIIKPSRLDYTRPDRAPDDPAQADRKIYRWGDWFFVGGLLYLMLTGFLVADRRDSSGAPGL